MRKCGLVGGILGNSKNRKTNQKLRKIKLVVRRFKMDFKYTFGGY